MKPKYTILVGRIYGYPVIAVKMPEPDDRTIFISGAIAVYDKEGAYVAQLKRSEGDIDLRPFIPEEGEVNGVRRVIENGRLKVVFPSGLAVDVGKVIEAEAE